MADGKFREFLQIQTKLHETVCGKREKSTIATHDLTKLPAVNGNFVRYTAKDADQLRIHPLGKTKASTGIELYSELKAEADAQRKQKQRNTYSGIHKYLKLLEDQRQYACVEDGLGNVISLPPLTNGESTKVSTNFSFGIGCFDMEILFENFLLFDTQISTETTKLFIEVTSNTSMKDCMATMEALLLAMVQGGFGATGAAATAGANILDLQQVKIVDTEGKLRRVFPAKGDLVFDANELVAVELQQ